MFCAFTPKSSPIIAEYVCISSPQAIRQPIATMITKLTFIRFGISRQLLSVFSASSSSSLSSVSTFAISMNLVFIIINKRAARSTIIYIENQSRFSSKKPDIKSPAAQPTLKKTSLTPNPIPIRSFGRSLARYGFNTVFTTVLVKINTAKM